MAARENPTSGGQGLASYRFGFRVLLDAAQRLGEPSKRPDLIRMVRAKEGQRASCQLSSGDFTLEIAPLGREHRQEIREDRQVGSRLVGVAGEQ